MLEKIQLLKKWISNGEVVAKFRNNRSEDDLTTLVNQLEIYFKQLPRDGENEASVGGSVCHSCNTNIADEFIPKCFCPECGVKWHTNP